MWISDRCRECKNTNKYFDLSNGNCGFIMYFSQLPITAKYHDRKDFSENIFNILFNVLNNKIKEKELC